MCTLCYLLCGGGSGLSMASISASKLALTTLIIKLKARVLLIRASKLALTALIIKPKARVLLISSQKKDKKSSVLTNQSNIGFANQSNFGLQIKNTLV